LITIVKVQFHTAEKLYDFNAAGFELTPGDRVIVETERGRSMAIVVTEPTQIPEELAPEGLKGILRKATDQDIEAANKNREREQETFDFCQQKIIERGMDMKLVKVEYLYDNSKAIFYFTADGRVDFRDLVKDLAHQFHTRIEMRQIGVRDEAKMVGGIGICGRELCCASFLREFIPVSVKMAKEQGLALNPVKISGQCGRLLCCLGYEFDTYCSIRKELPKCGKHISCKKAEGEVIKVDILHNSFTLKTNEETEVICTLNDLKGEEAPEIQQKPPKQEEKPSPIKEEPLLKSQEQKGAPQKENDGKQANDRNRKRNRHRRRKKDHKADTKETQ